jgi:16S rRNA (guanine527-N7)-methyltransferase
MDEEEKGILGGGEAEASPQPSNLGPRREDALFVRLERACRILQCEITEEKLKRARMFLEELSRWNRAYNLVGRRVSGEGLIEHFIDSLTPIMYEKLFEEGLEMLDLGSGAGFPGIPLYIFKGPMDITLVEPARKKQSFLRHAKRLLCMDELKVLGARSEDMVRKESNLNGYDRIFMRAVAEPQKAVRISRPLLSSGGILVLFLGKEGGDSLGKKGGGVTKLGMRMENMRSTRKITGKDNYIALLRKEE